MAAPSYVDAGTGATDAGGVWSYTCQAPAAAGRVIVVQILQDGASTGVVAVTGNSNINNLAGSAGWTTVVAEAPVGASSEALQSIFIGRATSTSAPTISGTNSTSEDLYIRSYQFTNVSTGTTLATVIENSTAGNATNGTGTDNTALDTSVTTVGPDRLALNLVAINDDDVISAFTGETGGDWTLAVAPYAESSGTDGAIGLQQSYATSLSNASWSTTLAIYGDGGTLEQDAQSFTTGSAITVTSILVGLSKTGNPAGTLYVEIQTDASNTPSGTVLASASMAESSLTTSVAAYSFAFSRALDAATKYWIVLRRSARDATNYVNVAAASTSNYAGGGRNAKASGAWSVESSSVDHLFAVLTAANQAGATIDGGTENHVDSDAWGVVGFALIGTTPSGPTYQPRDAETFHDFR